MGEIEILKELVKFNTIKDKENEKILNYIEQFLEKLNFKVEQKSKYIIMEYGKECGLTFLGHSDTVELTDGWNTNPFELTQRDNKLYGLGACDMKGGIAAFLQALAETNLNKLKKGIKVCITYDEEIGFQGIEDVVKYESQKQEGWFSDITIIGEPTNNIPMTGCKGLLAVKIYTKGVKVHSSTPHKGKSANSSMIKLLSELEEFYNEKIKQEEDEIYDVPYTTMNIGLLNGGSAINSVASECMSYVDFRIAKQSHIEKIKQKLIELCKKNDATYEIDVDIEPFYEEIPFIKEVHTAGFMTEASFIKGKRIILGPGPVTAHEVNEYVSIESLNEVVNQYKEIIQKTCLM